MPTINFRISDETLWLIENKAAKYYPTQDGGDKSKLMRFIIDQWMLREQQEQVVFMPIHNHDGTVERVVKVAYHGDAKIDSVEAP
jgi:hypothetical protein